MDAKIVKVEVRREEINYAHEDIAAALQELVPAKSGTPIRLPLGIEHIRIHLRNAPTAVANALRRVLAGELWGRCLDFDRDQFAREETTDPFMNDSEFLRNRIRLIPLRPYISSDLIKSLRFAVDVENTTTSVMTVYSGDLLLTGGTLKEPLFNPTHEIAFVQPGRTLRITDIYISEGHGSDPAYAVAARVRAYPLDIEEYPRTETHSAAGRHQTESGYVLSSLVANPREHMIEGDILGVPVKSTAAVSVAIDACASIVARLRVIMGVIEDAVSRESASEGISHRAETAYFLVSASESSGIVKGQLVVKEETDTIGNLLKRSVYELVPDIKYVGYKCVPHERRMDLTIEHSLSDAAEMGLLVIRAAKHAHDIFVSLQRDLQAYV